MGDDNAPASIFKGLGASLRNNVPVLWANVVAEHVSNLDRIKLSDACQLGNGIKHFFRFKFRFNSTRCVIHL